MGRGELPSQPLSGNKPLRVRGSRLLRACARAGTLVQGHVVPDRPHGLEGLVEVAVHLLVVGQGGLVAHPALHLQGLAQLQLQVFALLVQDPQPLPVLRNLSCEACDGAL